MSGLTPGGFCRSAPVTMIVPEEPPVGTWVMDRFGATHYHQVQGGWGEPGIMPFGQWKAIWQARGPLVECSPWGTAERRARAMEEERAKIQKDLDDAVKAVEDANKRLLVATAQYGAWVSKYVEEK